MSLLAGEIDNVDDLNQFVKEHELGMLVWKLLQAVNLYEDMKICERCDQYQTCESAIRVPALNNLDVSCRRR